MGGGWVEGEIVAERPGGGLRGVLPEAAGEDGGDLGRELHKKVFIRDRGKVASHGSLAYAISHAHRLGENQYRDT